MKIASSFSNNKMSCLSALFNRRTEQHQNESVIDSKLTCLPCQNTVSNYLLHYRRLNRQQTEAFDKAGIFDMYSIAKKTMDEVDGEQKIMMDILLSNADDQSKCDQISRHIT